MDCDLNASGRQLRLVPGAILFMVGILLIILVYLQLIGSWGWIAGGSMVVSGIGGLLEACYGKSILQSLARH